MKKQAIIASILALTAIPAYAAIDCATPPTCESLGYTDTSTACAGKFLPCPMDSSKGFCTGVASCSDLGYTEGVSDCNGRAYLACPFSSSSVICLDGNDKGCSLLGNRYYDGTKCTSSGTTGYYIGKNYVVIASVIYAGSSASQTDLMNYCTDDENVMVSSSELEMFAKSRLKSVLGKLNYMTADYSCRKWDGTKLTSITCAAGFYTICKRDLYMD